MLPFPIIDTHLHFWDTEKLHYPWLDNIPFLNRTFLLDDYNKACNGINVESMIFVQCECEPSQYRQEVEWVTKVAEEDKRIKGIVSWAPLEKGEKVRDELEILAKNKLVKGIRRIIQFEPDLDFCIRPDFIKGVNMLKDYNFTFDICISYKHNRNTIRFVEQCQDIPMILDHIGKPDIKNKMVYPWKDEIKELSKFRNVFCKISSLATEADHKNWTMEDIRPFADHIFECFGFDRTVFAGDWPVSTLAADFPTCVETIEKLLKGYSETELKKLFHDNAIKFYKI
jgi:L-fuconolactonase